MKPILYLFLLLSVLHLDAQPVISADAIVNIGEEESTTFLPIQGINWDNGVSGPDVSWDYSTLAMGALCDYVAMDPMNSPYSDSFPDSDIYFVCTFSDSQGFVVDQHTFYNIDGDILQLAGNVSISITNPSFDSIFIVYTDPLDWGTFPYSYEETSEDTFEARVTSYIGNQTILAIQSGTSTQEVDSYGTLTTPAGTFENTLRVKRIEMAENSIPGIPFTSPQETYRYTWYAENENGVILNLDSIVIKDFNDNVLSTELTGSYRTMGPTSTSTLSTEEYELKVFPNPVIDEFTLKYSDLSKYKLYIYTVDGKEVPHSITSSTVNSSRVKLSNPTFESGIFFIKLIDKGNNVQTSKPILIGN